ncbi:MAG: GTP-binding protein [Tatlockia sp.]|nr:GTP-binding protein [Tatlockia sp.]
MTFKVIVLGNKKVGKTALTHKLANPRSSFDLRYKPTVGADFLAIIIDNIPTHIWDISCQQLGSSFYKGTDLAIFCIDLSEPLEESDLRLYIEKYRVFTADSNDQSIPMILVGTKADLSREISDEQFDQLIEKFNFKKGIKISSKENKNISELKIILSDTLTDNKVKTPFSDHNLGFFNNKPNHNLPAQSNDLINIISSYLKNRSEKVDENGKIKIYLHSYIPQFFQKSFMEKRNAVNTLTKALNGDKVDLASHLSTLRNGDLGNQLRKFIKDGHANSIVGFKVKTVREFVAALDAQVNPKNSLKN